MCTRRADVSSCRVLARSLARSAYLAVCSRFLWCIRRPQLAGHYSVCPEKQNVQSVPQYVFFRLCSGGCGWCLVSDGAGCRDLSLVCVTATLVFWGGQRLCCNAKRRGHGQHTGDHRSQHCPWLRRSQPCTDTV